MQNYNPYENMLNTLDVAAEKLGYTRNDYEVLRHPERELKVSVPLQLDNGEVRVYEGYRCQHSTLRGSAKVSVSIQIPMKTKCVHQQLG